MRESDRFLPIRRLGLIACAIVGSLRNRAPISPNIDAWGSYHCYLCDSEESTLVQERKAMDSNSCYELFTTLENLIKLDEYRASPQARIWGVMTLRRLLNHTEEPSYLNVEASILGQWCLATLNTSIRELRIAARCVCFCVLLQSHQSLITTVVALYHPMSISHMMSDF